MEACHTCGVPTVLCPGLQDQLSCAGVGLHTSEGTQIRLVGFEPAWTLHSQPYTSAASANAPATLGTSGEHQGPHGRGAVRFQSCCPHCPISTSRLKSRWKLATFCAPQCTTVPNRAHPLPVFDDNIDCNAMRCDFKIWPWLEPMEILLSAVFKNWNIWLENLSVPSAITPGRRATNPMTSSPQLHLQSQWDKVNQICQLWHSETFHSRFRVCTLL